HMNIAPAIKPQRNRAPRKGGARDFDLGGCTLWFGVTTFIGRGMPIEESNIWSASYVPNPYLSYLVVSLCITLLSPKLIRQNCGLILLICRYISTTDLFIGELLEAVF
ncbi:MAG: hypothetical protein WC174_02330, partial [Bacilli bacterium]